MQSAPLSRRGFIHRLAAAGGSVVAWDSLSALGLVAAPSQAPFELRGRVNGVRVAVLGAGLAGLAVAYELSKLGYECRVLEAQPRPGGRAHTVRGGTVSEEDGPRQVSAFDQGHYYNPGAMRIPHHHTTVMAYCRELQVPIEPFCNQCDAVYLYQTKTPGLAGQRVRLREARADLDGYLSEMLAKVVAQDRLDEPLTAEDREQLLAYLREMGALTEAHRYEGTTRRGYADLPSVGDDRGERAEPLDFGALLGSRVGLYLQQEYPYQATMFQIVGGTDRLPAAFAARLQDRIVYRAAVRRIRQDSDTVHVDYADRDGRQRTVEADYCVCTIPLPVLAKVDAGFSPAFTEAVASSTYASAGKIGLQFKRRFWEEDDAIYGGSSRTDQEIAQIVYPSYGFNGRKGVLIGYYIQGQHARPVGERTPAERLELALDQGSRIHPQYRSEFENGFSVAWHRVPWNLGSWAGFPAEARKTLYPRLLKPEGRVYLAGDHVSNINAWIQGAFESARHVATEIHARAASDRPRSRVA